MFGFESIFCQLYGRNLEVEFAQGDRKSKVVVKRQAKRVQNGSRHARYCCVNDYEAGAVVM